MIRREKDVVVPRGIRYLSEWKDFKLNRFPKKFILDKQLPGCGFTNYCLSSLENVVLCSPRKVLLENKAYSDKFKDEVYLVINEASIETSIDKNIISKPLPSDQTIPIEQLIKVESFIPEVLGEFWIETEVRVNKEVERREKGVYKRLSREISDYVQRRSCEGKPVKILVTYDSYRLVRSILSKIGFNDYYTVVDEYQALLQDATFKADVEVNFFYELENSERVCFASATPMLEEYMNLLEEFNGLPYFTLDWATEDPGRIVKPDLKVLTMRSTATAALPIIRDYLAGNFEKSYRRVPETEEIEVIESKEAMFYVNSINQIANIISKAKLEPSQVNILCADTPNNRARIRRKLGSRWKIGKVPKESEPNKMFTFCTRTVYLGADFYSDNARSFIFSDSNIETLAVDIGEDLPQILGRQRSDKNPWKHSATFFYRSTVERKEMTQESLNERVEQKKKRTSLLLSAYDRLVGDDEKGVIRENYRIVATAYNYKLDYVSIKGNIPVLNMFVLLNEIRSFRIQQIDYKDRFTIFAKIASTLNPSTDGSYSNQDILDFMKTYDSYTRYYDKMKLLCENNLSESAMQVILNQLPDSDDIKNHYVTLGKKKCKALSYNITYISDYLRKVSNDHTDMLDEIYSEFKVGESYFISYVKKKILEIYSKYRYLEKCSSHEIEKYFEVKEFLKPVVDPIGVEKKRLRAYKILKKRSSDGIRP